jgi:hypothetical protein
MPTITGIANEATEKKSHYDGVLTNMKKESFGNNGTGFGDDDMIRKNILYSLNAQNPSYIIKTLGEYKKEIYYNYGFTGMYPIFTWIPLNSELKDDDKYNFSSIDTWQPYGTAYRQAFVKLGNVYKNYGVSPWSTMLNENIRNIITGSLKSIKCLPSQFKTQMEKRINETVGVYKDLNIEVPGKKKTIYLYHGSKNKIHAINDRENDIEILGFLSTTLNVHTASYYSEVGLSGNGFIYIIEVDEMHPYINLNDNLYQILLLPHSIIRVVQEFNFGKVKVVLCRLIRTPTIEENCALYDKLLGIDNAATVASQTVYYNIKDNDMHPFICGKVTDDDVWMSQETALPRLASATSKNMPIYKVLREQLTNTKLGHWYPLKTPFVYFSLGQENELYISRGLPVEYGGLADIKYTLHQHFIKDCYWELRIPCIDYFFIYGSKNNAIATGILLDDYKKNRSNVFKYDINNFLIDCIFKFDSIENAKKTFDLPIEMDPTKMYADKIENFRDAGLYMNGVIDPFFRGTYLGEHLQFLEKYISANKNVLAKYADATNEVLERHFTWCNSHIERLIDTIEEYKKYYIEFIKAYLGTSPEDPTKVAELVEMIETLTSILRERAMFYFKATSKTSVSGFTRIIVKAIKEPHANVHSSNLHEDAVLAELKFPPYGPVTGGDPGIDRRSNTPAMLKAMLSSSANANAKAIANAKASSSAKASANAKASSSAKAIASAKASSSASSSSISSSKAISSAYHEKMYEAYKNVPIQQYRDMRRFKDMPQDMQKYYGGAANNEEYIDISGHCYVRLISRKEVDKMIENDHANGKKVTRR